MPVRPTSGNPFDTTRLSRRGFLAAGVAGGFALAGCGGAKTATSPMTAAIDAAEAARPHSGRTVTASLTP